MAASRTPRLTPGRALPGLSDPADARVAPGVTSPSTPAVGLLVGGGIAGREVDVTADGVDVAFGRGDARTAGVGVAAGGGVSTGHVPAGDGGGGSAPVCGSNRNPMSSPLATVTLEAPRAEVTQAPPACDTNRTQYDPAPLKQLGG